MRIFTRIVTYSIVIVAAFLVAAAPAWADGVQVQFPYDIDNNPVGWSTGGARGNEDVDWNMDSIYNGPPATVKYLRFGASDGYVKTADGSDIYTFGFMDLTGVPEAMGPGIMTDIMAEGVNKGDFPAPTLIMNEGDEVYLNLTNLGMLMRPDLFDEHTLHFHGFPNASAVFDGEPMASIGVKMMSTITYYYHPVDPGTYMFHCHVEATEHMEMGMLGNLVVRPAQNGTTYNYNGKDYSTFAYNDGDGRTGYDVEALVKIGDFDPVFHANNEVFQALPFADYEARYFMLNGRGYPETVNTAQISNKNGYPAQKMHTLVTVDRGAGQRTLLLRVINLSIQNFTTLEVPGLRIKVAAKCAKLLRGPNSTDGTGPGAGNDTSYYVSSALVGPGESIDLLIDTQGVQAGTYYLFSRNLDQLNNNLMDRGGIMTEIVIN